LIEDEAEQEEPPGAEPRARGETVLVVEDDPDLRALTITFLENLGYPVLEAAEGAAALTVMASGRVDVLLTDVVLPGDMNGSQIAAAAAERFPDLKVLYMSGYTRDAIVHNGTLDDGVLLLEKPFRKTDLARKLREAIEA
jgi:CheY-like chemotaxis protein